jgi:hypothetical protein
MKFESPKYKITGFKRQFNSVETARMWLRKKDPTLFLQSRNGNYWMTETWLSLKNGKVYKISI